MKIKTALLFACCLASASASAEWVKVKETEKNILYTDIESMRRTGDILKVWLLNDYKVPQWNDAKTSKLQSVRTQILFNCREDTMAVAVFSSHTELQARGSALRSETFKAPDWEPVAPNTALFDIMRLSCKHSK